MKTEGDPIPFERLQTLLNLLNMYEYRDEDNCVNEAIANAVDAFGENSIKNGKIDITFEKGKEYGYMSFHNNATPMNKEHFEKKYHTVSLSPKKKGEGIGFAGVGAKLFLASNQGGEIITVTGSGKSNFYASKMYRTVDDVKFKTSIKYPLQEILGTNKYSHKFGTTYRVRLSLLAYKYLKEKIVTIIQFWWNYALLIKSIIITVDGKPLVPWEPKGKKYERSFNWKKHKIKCIYWISNDPLPEECRHTVYTVFGKRIHNDTLDIIARIKSDYGHRVYCIVDASILAGYLTSNKERFERNWQTNNFRHETQKSFWAFLEEQGLLTAEEIGQPSHFEIVNELTKRLDKLLNTKEFKDLNPFLSPRKLQTAFPDQDGDLTVSVEAKNDDNDKLGPDRVDPGTGLGSGSGSGIGTGPGGAKDGYVVDEEGNDIGSIKEKTSKGIKIILTEDFPEYNEEAWVDLSAGAVVVNIKHPFWINLSKNTILSKFNLNRILIEALIKFKNEEVNWDAKETLDHYRDLLHKTWMLD